jgi:hypothetical protein
MSNRPLWLRGFNRVERAVGGPLEAVIRSEAFLTAVTVAKRTHAGVGNSAGHVSRRALHVLNLPAHSDVRRLGDQLARMDRQMRTIAKRLEDQDSERR